jgi:hypothetical protein
MPEPKIVAYTIVPLTDNAPVKELVKVSVLCAKE